MRHVAIVGVGLLVQIGPEKGKRLAGDHLQCLVDMVQVFAAQSFAKAAERVALAEAGQGGAGELADLRAAITPRLLETA